MIEIDALLKQTQLPGNYFAFSSYVRGDLELGLLENRRGDRILALPDTLVRAIYKGLEQETGQAARLVLFNCGRWWGKHFYVRFCEEIAEYYHQPLGSMEMIQFTQCLQQCWKTHGWGTLEIDGAYSRQGFLLIKTSHSPFSQAAPEWKRPVCYLEAGLFSTFFSQLTGRDLHCVQTSCQSLGADYNRFIVGLSDRLKTAEAMVDENQDHDTILRQLCQQKSG